MKTPKKLVLPPGITVHGGYLRIAFRPPNSSRQKRVSLRIPPTKKNIDAAVLLLAKIKLDITIGAYEIGKYFPDHPDAKEQPLTLLSVMERFYRQEAIKNQRAKGTLEDIDVHMKLFEKSIGNVDLKTLRKIDIDGLYTAMEKVTTQKTTIRLMGKVKTAVKRAVAAELLAANPFEFASPPAKPEKKPLSPQDVMTMDEAEAVIADARRIREELGNVLQFAFWSGARPGEIASLRKSDVDLPFVNIERNMQRDGDFKSPKTDAGIRRIHLPRKAAEAVKAQMALHDGPHLFTNMGGPFTYPRLVHTKTWRNILKRTIGRTLPQYRTRHSFISWMVNAGERPLKIADHVGHRDTKMIEQVYVRFIPDKEPTWILDE